MTALPQHRTTLSGQSRRGKCSLQSPPPAAHISQNVEQVGRQYGRVKIMTAERRYNERWSCCYVQVECTKCGHQTWASLSNLMQGKSQGCDPCARRERKSPVPKWLDRRLTAAKQRCTNPADPAWGNYGARGIEFRFSSVTEAGKYVMSELGLRRELEIDRIRTDGHYEPGNLRYATRETQQRNRRDSKLSTDDFEWIQTQSPYAFHTSTRLLKKHSRAAIIAMAKQAVRGRAKNWRGIQSRLEQLGCTTL